MSRRTLQFPVPPPLCQGKEEGREELMERLQTELALCKGKSRTPEVSIELALREFAGKIDGKSFEKHIKETVLKV